MNYRKTKSRPVGFAKTNVPLVLIASCILAVLLVIVAAPSYPAHAQRGKGDSSQIGDQTPAVPLATPEPYFGVAWTAEANTSMDVINGQTRTITQRHIVMAGTIIVRKLDNLPDPFGDQDNLPFNVNTGGGYSKSRIPTLSLRTANDANQRQLNTAGFCGP